MSVEVLDLTGSDWDDDAFVYDDERRGQRVSKAMEIIDSVGNRRDKGKAKEDASCSPQLSIDAMKAPRPLQQRRPSGNANKRPRTPSAASDDDEIEILEAPIAGSSKSRTHKRQRTSPSENVKPKPQPRPSTSHDTESRVASTSKPKQGVRPPKVTKRTLAADERLARKLAAQERKEYEALCKQVEKKKEGIVFRVVVNADGNLDDGSPAHPDDLDRFEPWRQLFEKGSNCKVKRFHWIVNYELEKRFEEARVKLREIMGCEPEEKQLFHGTSAANIESILSEGFRIGGVGKHRVTNGTAMGYGIYLAQDGETSMDYALGADRIFACRVLPGRVTQSYDESKRKPTQAVGSGRYESYNAGNVYVVRHTALVLPCYMIEWDVDELYRNATTQHNQIMALAGGANGLAHNINAGNNFNAMMGTLLGGAPNGTGMPPFVPQVGAAPMLQRGVAPQTFPTMLAAPAWAGNGQTRPPRGTASQQAEAAGAQRADAARTQQASGSGPRKDKGKAAVSLATPPRKYDDWEECQKWKDEYGEWPDEYDEVHHLDSPDPYEEC
ncbi:ADP-ribosylation [Schizophyllum commune H4-8]|nr:ADP-ribosylation [Schizophyllum commune H4-8]KAI5894927.1 ADP-ribosylation [Schizophyllum commune H4-8]